MLKFKRKNYLNSLSDSNIFVCALLGLRITLDLALVSPQDSSPNLVLKKTYFNVCSVIFQNILFLKNSNSYITIKKKGRTLTLK